MLVQGGTGQTQAQSGKRIPSNAEHPGDGSKKLDSFGVQNVVAERRGMVPEEEQFCGGQEQEDVNAVLSHQRKSQSGNLEDDILMQDSVAEQGSENLSLQANAADKTEIGHQTRSHVQCVTVPTCCVLQPIAESPYNVTRETSGEDGEMKGQADNVCDAVDHACGDNDELPAFATPAGDQPVARVQCDHMKGMSMLDTDTMRFHMVSMECVHTCC